MNDLPVSHAHKSGELTPMQRGAYLLGGLVLAAAGAKPRPNPLLSLAALGAGAYLAWRGAEGSCPLKAMIDEERAGSRGMIEPG
ncbi:MAG TPA: hypothetical protein VNS22_25275 [Geminicoccus sp.]|uniref:hypothetical protein n=1 Tax=Geminicoccus sp. TaxID=2024832 RepID=UPI002C7BEDB0|nr:hypothetical protein [Geminicoccus sp.]HWL71670.1 hypothetical protein [Geminicoccus sp.]